MDSTGKPVLPLALNGFDDALAFARIPSAPFSPAGRWENRYRLWVVRMGRQIKPEQLGVLVIRHQPIDHDQVALGIDLEAGLRRPGTGDVYVHSCQMICNSDALLSPISWTVHTHLESSATDLVPLSEFDETGSLANGTVHITGRRPFTTANPITTSWSLFAAVQRGDFATGINRSFDMLDEMDQPKSNQVIRRRAYLDVPLGEQSCRTHGYAHLGDGILPRDYWLDERGQLVMVTAGMRAYLMDPSAELTTRGGRHGRS